MASVAKKSPVRKAETALSLLRAAAKPAKAALHGPFDYDGNLEQVAGKVLDLARQRDEIDRELALAKDEVRRSLDGWYRGRLASYGYEASVKVAAAGRRVLRVTYPHRYLKLAGDKSDAIQAVVGDAFGRFFKPTASLKLRKEIADDPEKLTDVVEQLGEALGDKFAAFFEAEIGVTPTKAFTERRWAELEPGANDQLEAAGVKQVVSFAEGR